MPRDGELPWIKLSSCIECGCARFTDASMPIRWRRCQYCRDRRRERREVAAWARRVALKVNTAGLEGSHDRNNRRRTGAQSRPGLPRLPPSTIPAQPRRQGRG
jgi:hypothetical protein